MSIEIRKIVSADAAALTRFFKVLIVNGIDAHFHPHPLTSQAAQERASYTGQDLYFAILEDGEVLGYGMLRGWDAGYKIPSLGIAIHPNVQGQGFGRLLMNFLHVVAMRRGAKQVRLHVHSENHLARKLYQSLGYQFSLEYDSANLIGVLSLD